ncbi:TetR family transcriptional regulator [Verrucosispora sp. ts21]|uniref:TetR family transcriptional regulator n=1 Tax=Verrucosispora sp. ts21 TaxID=2069341 RepID=UPI000C88112D|nr:TetR family transcriptional regulator [Verrucosispora sp. ts21]PMR59034.1 TetR family transcriptional regulator [Verrucosispora sp. ts21]
MTWAETDGTRERILRAAFDLFTVHGYQRTSLRRIAERLGLTKAAILYHFPSKGHLLTALAEPMVGDLERLVDAAETLPPGPARWTLLEGWVDTMLEHRGRLGLLLHDLALVDQGSTYQRLLRIAMRANQILAGPDPSRRDRVRAVQAIAMCSDPVVFLMEVPAPVLRADMLDGVRRLLTDDPHGTDPRSTDPLGADRDGSHRSTDARDVDEEPAVGAVGRRRPGRPRSMGPEQLLVARRMHAAGTHSIDEIAAACGVSRATLYRHLNSPDNNETVSG